jgi:RNA polymerase sigma-70 factor (ECF subfamily)
MLAMAPEPDAADLAARMRDGDARAFEGWVRETHVLVYRLCRRLVANASDAEDAVQETYLRAWRSAARLRDPAAHRGWVCRIARHVCADRARGSATREPALDPDAIAAGMRALAADAPGADEALANAQARAVVVAAVGRLKPKHRIVLLLREVDDLEYEEIADALGVPRGTVESRLHRARAELARVLERYRVAAERRTP